MADGSKIEWTDATWNPITGCSVVSPGCTNCYAMRLAGTRLQHHWSRKGLTRDTKAGPVWTGEVRFNEQWLDQPLRWSRPRMIFVAAHGDLFHEAIPDEWIDRVFAVMSMAPRHTFQVLTKRPERMKAWFEERWQPARAYNLGDLSIPAETAGETRRTQVAHECEELLDRFGLADPDKDELWTVDGSCKAMQWSWPLPNVWLGVSAEDQARANERIPILLDTPAAVRWLSAEPLLGPLDLTNLDPTGIQRRMGAHGWSAIWKDNPIGRAWLDWVVIGGESGPGSRRMEATWARSLRDQCVEAGVAFHFKQWGHFDQAGRPVGKKTAGRELDGRTWDKWPS